MITLRGGMLVDEGGTRGRVTDAGHELFGGYPRNLGGEGGGMVAQVVHMQSGCSRHLRNRVSNAGREELLRPASAPRAGEHLRVGFRFDEPFQMGLDSA